MREKRNVSRRMRMEMKAPNEVLISFLPRMFSTGTGTPNISNFRRNLENTDFIICLEGLILL